MAQLNYLNPTALNPYQTTPQGFLQGWNYPQMEADYRRMYENQMSLADLSLSKEQFRENEFRSPTQIGARELQQQLLGQQSAGAMSRLPYETNEAIASSKLNTQNMRNQLTQALFDAGFQQKDMETARYLKHMKTAIPLLRNFVNYSEMSGTPVDFSNPQTIHAAGTILEQAGVPMEKLRDQYGNYIPEAGQVLGSMAMADDAAFNSMYDAWEVGEKGRQARALEQEKAKTDKGRGMTNAEWQQKLYYEVQPLLVKEQQNPDMLTSEEKAKINQYRDYQKSQAIRFQLQGDLPGRQMGSMLDAIEGTPPPAPTPSRQVEEQTKVPKDAESAPNGAYYEDDDGSQWEIIYRRKMPDGRTMYRIRQGSNFRDIYQED